MDYGTGAIFGVPGHDQRDFEFAKQYHLPIQAGRRAECRRSRAADRRGSRKRPRDHGQFRLPRRHADRRGDRRGHPPRRNRRLGQGHHRVAAARLGRIAPALLGDADPDHPLPDLRRGAGAARPAAGGAARGRRRSSCPATRSTATTPGGRCHARRAAARRLRETDTLDTFVEFQLVLHPLRQPAQGPAVRPRRGRGLAAGRAIYRRRRACDPAPALRALLDPGAAAHRPHRHRRAVQGPVHPRHGDPRDLPVARRSLAGARGSRGRRRRQARRARDRGRRSTAAASRRCPSRGATPSTPSRSSPNMAPTRCAGSCCPTARPSATSNGRKPASRARRGSSSASGGWRTAGSTGEGDDAGARQEAPPRHRRHRRGDRGAAVQQGGRPIVRAGQRDRESRAVGQPRRGGAHVGQADCADGAAPRRGSLGGAGRSGHGHRSRRGRRSTPRCWSTTK